MLAFALRAPRSPDLRSERTCHQVMLPESHRLLHEEMAKIPTGVRHIVLASTIPVTYLRFPCVEPHKFVHMQRILARDGAHWLPSYDTLQSTWQPSEDNYAM